MSQPIRSMTGFARVQRHTDLGEIVVSLKSVNHKGLDLHFHMDSGMDAFEGSMRGVLKKSILRGHIDIRCAINSPGQEGNGQAINTQLVRSCVAAFRKLAAEEGLDEQPDLNHILRLPGMYGAASADIEPDPALEPLVLDLLAHCMESLNQFRAREGEELADFIRQHNQALAAGAVEMADIRTRALPAFQERLSNRLNELVRNPAFDPQRIAQEAAVLADRSDIGEEIARLQIHSRQLDEILNAGGEVGKKLDFLLQEMNRETNTILSKTSGIGELGLRITDLALASKANIEKIREQALNLE